MKRSQSSLQLFRTYLGNFGALFQRSKLAQIISGYVSFIENLALRIVAIPDFNDRHSHRPIGFKPDDLPDCQRVGHHLILQFRLQGHEVFTLPNDSQKKSFDSSEFHFKRKIGCVVFSPNFNSGWEILKC